MSYILFFRVLHIEGVIEGVNMVTYVYLFVSVYVHIYITLACSDVLCIKFCVHFRCCSC